MGFPDIPPRPRAQWTVLVYYGGDNNLEAGILNDLDEFEVGGGAQPEAVNIVALVDRNPRFTDSNGNWDTVRLFEMGPDVTGDHDTVFPPTIDTEPLADLGELDTSDGETLARFLVWSMARYPAEHYIVAFASHGAAWQGLIQDDTSQAELLTIPELQKAFALALDQAQMDKFDLLINDACLMSSVEYFAGLSDFFHYSIASPEIVVDPALDMASLLTLIEGQPEVNIPLVGTHLVDRYITQDIRKRGSSDIAYLTHAITNLDDFDPVVQAVEHFAQIINRNPAVYSPLIGEARTNTYTYTSFLGENTYIDLGSFMRRIIALSTDSDVIAAAEEVLAALDVARLYGNAGEKVMSRTSYYNIYFPDTSKAFKQAYFNDSPLKAWGKMLRSYYNSVTPQVWIGDPGGIGFHLPIAPQLRITNIYPQDTVDVFTQVNLSLEIVGRRIAYGDFTVDQVQDDGSVVRLSQERVLTDVIVDGQLERFNRWRPGVQISDFFWDVTLPVVSDGTSAFNELLVFTEDVGFLDGRYREPGSDIWNDVGVVFDINADYSGGQVQRIINRSPDSNALAVIDIPVGAEFQAYRAVVTPDGRVVAEPGHSYRWPEGGLTWEWQPAPDGQYNLGLLLTAFGGTTGFASTSVDVANSSIPATLRGDTWLDVGFTLPHPADWTRSAFSPEDFLIRSYSPDRQQNITVYFVPGVGDDLTAIAEGFAEQYGVTLTGPPTPTSLAGAPALAIEYTVSDGTSARVGRGYALYHDIVGVGMVFASETTGDADDLAPLTALLADHLVLIDLNAVAEADSSTWTLPRERAFGYVIEYPMRLDWEEASGDEAWQRFVPAEDPHGGTFVALHWEQAVSGTARDALERLVTDAVRPGTDDFTLTNFRTYYGDRHTWDVALYTATRAGRTVIGRVYAMILDGNAYMLWFETPDNEGAREIFKTRFEPIADGFLVEPEEGN